MSIRVGIVGISGFGGGEAMRLIASHPSFELVYAAAGAWTPIKSDTSEIKSFDEAPATMLHIVVRKR